MGEEIQLEALAQHRVVDLADPALPGGAGVRDDDVDAAETLGDPVERARAPRPDRSRRHAIAERRPSFFAAACSAPARSSSTISAPAPRIARAVAKPIVPAPPVTSATWPASGFSTAPAELCLLQRPVFDVEHFGLAHRLEPADRLGVGHGLDPGFGDIGGDRGVLGAAPEPEQAEPRHQDDPRHRVELALRRRLAALWRAK